MVILNIHYNILYFGQTIKHVFHSMMILQSCGWVS